ncbi:asparaginase-domain-containing protein [Hortaea werneckii]|nr:asparaginase-domain-containing protein [Hortaea werneckii]
MLSLPLLQPHQDPSTTLRNPFRPRADSPPPTTNPTHPNRPAPPPARSHRDEAERKHHAARSPLAILAADEAAISHRKSSIRNFGSYWIRPPGITKTLQAMNEEEAERIEQEEMARQERGLADLQAQQQLAEVRERAAATQAEGEGGEVEEEEGERDLDAEIPEAEEEEEEEEEDGGMSFNEESMMEGSSQIQTTGGMGSGRGVRGRLSGMGGTLPTAAEENDASFSRDLDVEGEGTSGQYALEMEEAELTGAARDEEVLGIVHEEERDLDDSVPEAGAYEHTDTELEDSSESESEVHDSFAAQSARRSVRSNAASARAAADDVAEGFRSSMQSATGLPSFGGGGNGGMGGLQERMRAQARGFLKQCLGPRPSFNDGSYPEPLEIITSPQGHRKAVQSLRTPISSYGRRVRYCVLEFDDLLDSSSVDARSWDQIARIIQQNYALFAGFVVLHGTDSLAYTSSALSFMLQNLAKPVILTGAQAPMMMLQSDAHDNLLGSLVIAGHFAIPEVCLYFNFKLLRGNRATKVATDDFDGFASPNMLPLATVGSSRTHVRWNLVLRRKTAELRNGEEEKLEVQSELDTAPVACLRVFPGMTAQMVDLFLHTEGLRGLILETFGSGNTPGGPDSPFTRVLADAVSRGIVIVNVSQCLSGSVSSIYAPAMTLQRAGVTFGQDMTTEAALTKLAYLLAQPGAEVESVAEKMSVDIKGELTERTGTFFEHP